MWDLSSGVRSGPLKAQPEGGGCQSPPMQGQELGRSSFPGHCTPAVQETAGLTDEHSTAAAKETLQQVQSGCLPCLCKLCINILKITEFLLAEFFKPAQQNQE